MGINLSEAVLKELAHKTKRELDREGVQLGHKKCLDLQARIHGFTNYEHAKAALTDREAVIDDAEVDGKAGQEEAIKIVVEWPVEPCEMAFAMTQGSLGRAIRQVKDAMADGDIRGCLNGMLLEANGTGVKFVASTGHVLAYTRCSVEMEMNAGVAILPREGVQKLAARLRDDSSEVDVQIKDGRASFSLGEAKIEMELVGGRYPDYERILGQTRELKAVVNRRMLMDAVKLVPDTEDEWNAVVLEFRKNKLQVGWKDAAHPCSSELAVEYAASDKRIALKKAHLMGGLSQMKGEAVRFEFGEECDNFVMKDTDGGDFTVAVAQMRA
jgi:DNA polymerase-3 subunit beta